MGPESTEGSSSVEAWGAVAASFNRAGPLILSRLRAPEFRRLTPRLRSRPENRKPKPRYLAPPDFSPSFNFFRLSGIFDIDDPSSL